MHETDQWKDGQKDGWDGNTWDGMDWQTDGQIGSDWMDGGDQGTGERMDKGMDWDEWID